MLTLELSIRSQTRTALPPHALLVTGESVQAWADEIVSWNADDHKLRLIVVPRSSRDRKPIGVLVFYPDGSPLRVPSHCLSTKTVEYGLIGSQIYLPCDATIEPVISEQEISKHLVSGRNYVWHPTAGLVAADENDLLSVSDLFSTPEQIAESWDQAHCGTAWAKQLISVAMLPEAKPTATDALEGGMDDIGSKAEEIESIDPIKDPDGRTEDPKRSPLGQARDAGVKGIAKFVRGMTSMAPVGGNTYTWVNKLEDWAAGKLKGIHEKIEQQRFKELFRLQKLLEQDPEEGLKYALPLNSNGTSRGVSAPSSRLSRNQTNFSLSGLRSGGPADYWDIPEDLRTKLNRQYRELAEREINLGRYRRAAYIYGKLLSDLNAAARTLEAGKHYREAAVLYRTKLNRNVDAARCLDKGGLWSELIALREELQQFEMAGDVYLKLGLEDQATAAFKKAVSQQLKQQNYIEAARIEEHKLRDIDATLRVLEQGWPATEQANLCIKAIFRVLGTAGRHEDSRDWISRIEDEFSIARSQSDVLKTLSGLANGYPDQTTRELAHESTFQIVSRALAENLVLGRAFLGSIADLHEEDKLLSRDCLKFKSQPISYQVPSSPASQSRSGNLELVSSSLAGDALTDKAFRSSTAGLDSEDKLYSHDRSKVRWQKISTNLVTTFSLPSKVDWVEGIDLGTGYVLVGQKNQHVTILKLSAEFKTLGQQTERLNNSRKANFLLAKTLDNKRVIVNCPLDKRFGDQEISATDDDTQATIVGSSWVDYGTIGIAQGQSQQWIIVRITDTNECLLEIQSSRGALLSSNLWILEFTNGVFQFQSASPDQKPI